MAIHKPLQPHLNASKHGYAHWLVEQVNTKKLTKQEAMQELNKRQDKDDILEILRNIKNGKNNTNV